MKTQTNTKIPFGKYQNQMWNQVVKVDTAYIKWAQNTKSTVNFTKNFLKAAGIELVNGEENKY